MKNSASSNKKSSRLSLILKSKSDGAQDVADWGSANGKSVIDLIQVVSNLGGAVRFGYTRDGGAYSVGVYLDDDRETFYCKPTDDLDDFITRLTGMLRDL